MRYFVKGFFKVCINYIDLNTLMMMMIWFWGQKSQRSRSQPQGHKSTKRRSSGRHKLCTLSNAQPLVHYLLICVLCICWIFLKLKNTLELLLISFQVRAVYVVVSPLLWEQNVCLCMCYSRTVELLAAECGCPLEHPIAVKFRSYVMDGEWDQVYIELLQCFLRLADCDWFWILHC